MNNKHLIELTTVLDNISQPIFIHDRQYKVLYANRAYIELSGKSENDIIGQVYWQAFPKGEGPIESCRKILEANQESAKERVVVIMPTGQRIYDAFSYVVKEGDAYLYSIHVFEDVTANVGLISQVKNDSALLERMFDYAGDAIFIVDFSGKIVDANKMAVLRMGCSYAELTQLSVFDIDKKITAKKLKQIALELKSQHQVYFESYLHPRNAQIFPVEINISLIEKNDTPYFLAMVRDVSNVHNLQEKLEKKLIIEQTVRQVQSILITQKSYKKKFQAAVDQIREGMNANRCYFFSYDYHKKIFTKQFESCDKATSPIDITPPLTTFGNHFPVSKKALLGNTPILIDSTYDEVIRDRHLRHIVKKHNIYSIYFIPINYQAVFYGFLWFFMVLLVWIILKVSMSGAKMILNCLKLYRLSLLNCCCCVVTRKSRKSSLGDKEKLFLKRQKLSIKCLKREIHTLLVIKKRWRCYRMRLLKK